MSLPFDAVLKDIIAQNPADFAGVFGMPKDNVPVALNVDLSTLSAATDVAFGFGTPLAEVVDLNFQSGRDPILPARLLLYNAAFHLRFGVPVRSIAVLLRPKADAVNLTEQLAYVSGGKRLEFEYAVVRLWQQPVEFFRQGGIGLLPLATLCKLPGDRRLASALRDAVGMIDRRLAHDASHDQAVRLMTAAFILTGMRVGKEKLSEIYDGVKIMHKSTAFDVMVEEGREQGLLEGIQRALLKLGSKKFGAPKKKTESDLLAVRDIGRLDRMSEAMLTAKSWKELLDTP